jgi:5'(3')-deoxyribonucleotidase
MEKYSFGVDIDEVLRALLSQMVKLYNKHFGGNMKIDDVFDYNVEICFSAIKEKTGISAKEWFFTLHGKELFRDAPMIKGAKEALEILREYGDVIIITRQFGIENKRYALEWLDKHGIPYDSICFVDDKSVVKCDYLIDDNVDNFKGCNIHGAILITAPYNKSEKDVYRLHTICNAGCFQRFDSILDFANDFEETHTWFKLFKKKTL